MKKALVVLMALIMVAVLTGCPSGKPDPDPKKNFVRIINSSGSTIDTIWVFTNPNDVAGSGKQYGVSLSFGQEYLVSGLPDDDYYIYAWKTGPGGVAEVYVVVYAFSLSDGETVACRITKMDKDGGTYELNYEGKRLVGASEFDQ